ncbi:MAG: FixH family protein [Anaerolineae bacterium]|jgi:hypothetical protein
MKRNVQHRVYLVGLVLLLTLLGCARGMQDLPDVGVDLSIEPDPPQMGPATVTVILTDAEGQPLEGAQMEIEGNMSHAGMVPVLAVARETSPGRYQAELEFTMVGDWFMLVRADLADGRSMERKIDLPAVNEICGDTPEP